MFIRLLFFILIFTILWWGYRQLKQHLGNNKATPNTSSEDQEAMIRCAQCGTYTPLSHAIKGSQGKYFCSKEHADDHKSQL